MWSSPVVHVRGDEAWGRVRRLVKKKTLLKRGERVTLVALDLFFFFFFFAHYLMLGQYLQ